MISRLMKGAAAAAILIGIVAVSASARPLDDVKASGQLNVVVYYDNKPFSWFEDGSDTPLGVEVDMARAVAKELGLKPNIMLRVAGESADDDVRSNVWQGPRTGGLKADIMFHVPIDREFIGRNQEAQISNSYHYEETVVAVHPDMVETVGLEAFEKSKIAVQFSTAGHYFLTFVKDGAIRNNVSPYSRLSGAVDVFKARDVAGLMGERSKLENALKDFEGQVEYFVPEIPSNYVSAWNYGTAVHTDGRDVAYAVGRILRKMRASGEMAEIFAKYGVTLRDPPVQRRRPAR